MCMVHIVVNDAGRYIQRVVVGLACCNRDRCLVASKDDWNEHGAMSLWGLCDLILCKRMSSKFYSYI